MIGMCCVAASALSRRVASHPSITGSPRSIRMRSGLADCATETACWPSMATTTSYPRRCSRRASASRLASLSSTTRIVAIEFRRVPLVVRPHAGRRRRLRCGLGHIERQAYDEPRPFTGTALDRHAAAHQIAEAGDDGQPEAGAAVLTGRGHIGLRERVEDFLCLFHRHADTCIRDAELNERGAVDRALTDVDNDRAVVGELAGVAQQVDEDLAR